MRKQIAEYDVPFLSAASFMAYRLGAEDEGRGMLAGATRVVALLFLLMWTGGCGMTEHIRND